MRKDRLNGDDLKFARNNHLREIDAIKKRFNKHEVRPRQQINVPLRKIESALLAPEIALGKEVKAVQLPAPGSRLIRNPAPEKKKKKVAKKKSKSRGR